MAKTQLFPLTHWSLVRRAGTPDAAARREALQTLLERYIPALRKFLGMTFRLRDEQTEEILQAFIADQVLVKQLIAHADQSKGRFRSYLLVSLRNYAVGIFRQRDIIRATGSDLTEVADEKSSSQVIIEASWVRALLNSVMSAMKTECETTGRPDIWQVFEERILLPIFDQAMPPSYENLAKRLGLSSPTQAANLLITGKRMYARLLRAAVGEYEREPDEIDGEIRELWKALANAPAFHETTTTE